MTGIKEKKVLRLVDNSEIIYRDDEINQIKVGINLKYTQRGVLFQATIICGGVEVGFMRLPTEGDKDWLGHIQHRHWFMFNKFFNIDQFRHLVEFERALWAYEFLNAVKYHKEIDALYIGRNLAYAIANNEMSQREIEHTIKMIIDSYMDVKFTTIIA